MAEKQIIITSGDIPYREDDGNVKNMFGIGNKNLPEGAIQLDIRNYSELTDEQKKALKVQWDGKYSGRVTVDNFLKFVRAFFREEGNDSIGIICPSYMTQRLSQMLSSSAAASKGLEDVAVYTQEDIKYTKIESKDYTPSLKDPIQLVDMVFEKNVKDGKRQLSAFGFHSAASVLKNDFHEVDGKTAKEMTKNGIPCLRYMTHGEPKKYDRAEYRKKIEAGEQLVPYMQKGAPVPGMYVNKNESKMVYLAPEDRICEALKRNAAAIAIRAEKMAECIASDPGLPGFSGYPACMGEYGKHVSYEMTDADGKKKTVSEAAYAKLSDEDKKKCREKDEKVPYTNDFIIRAEKKENEKAPQASALENSPADGPAPKDANAYDKEIDSLSI